MLLVAILAILSGQGSLLGMERFAKRHRKTLNQLLGTHIAKSPSDSTFRWLLSQLDVEGFESLLQQWITAQPGVPEMVDTLVSGGKTLRGSIAENASGAARYGLRPTASTSPRRACTPTAWAWPSLRTPTPLTAAARSALCGSCSIAWSSVACWCRRMRCMRTALFPLPRAAWRRLPDCRETQSPQGVSDHPRSADLWP